MIQELQPSCAPHTMCTVKRVESSRAGAFVVEIHIFHRVYLCVELDSLSQQPPRDAVQFLRSSTGDTTPAKR
jgi:hypothetical protein